MRVLLDTNVILDLCLAREPFWGDAAAVFAKIEVKELEGYICPTTVTTLHYLTKKVLVESTARSLLPDSVSICHVGVIASDTLNVALESKIKDFQDAVMESVARKLDLDAIITRNSKDFKHSTIPVKEPSEIQ